MEKDQIFTQMLPMKSYLQGKKYRIDRYIGSGGFGKTYEVTNLEFEERMALKEFFMKGISEREEDSTTVSVSNNLNIGTFNSQKEKFKKEARRLRRLHNPHIVQVHDLFEENGTAYYAMDFIDGESLSARLKKTGKPLSEAEALSVIRQVLDALETVHGQGIWHLDLKPANIMTDRDGVVKLIDFGASKQLSGNDGYTTTSSAMCYTPGYAPTEQIDQKMELIGPWTDLYALGATLYKLLTSSEPPTVSEMQEDDAFSFPKGVSEETKYLVRWMMTPRRQKRPQSVAEVRAFLDNPVVKVKPNEETVFEEKEKSEQEKKNTSQQKPRKPKIFSNSKQLITAGISAVVVIIAIIIFFVIDSNKVQTEDSMLVGAADSLSQPEQISPSQTQQNSKIEEPQSVQDYQYSSDLGVMKYSGMLDDDGKPNGGGEAKFSDGRYYRGIFKHGVMDGDAFFKYDNGDTFEGKFKNNAFSDGKYTIKEDGSYFIGAFKNGQPFDGIWYNKQGKKI